MTRLECEDGESQLDHEDLDETVLRPEELVHPVRRLPKTNDLDRLELPTEGIEV